MCAQRTRQESGGGEGIEILKNEPYEKEDGERGQFTHKVMHFKSRVPGFIRWAIPDKYLHLSELSHNSYPHFHTLYEMPGMGEDFYLLVDSRHVEYTRENGVDDNLIGLTPEELAIRRVEYLDIVNGKPKPDKPERDMHGFVCPEAGVMNPLEAPRGIEDLTKPPEWTEHYNGPMMICVKVVKFHFHWRGLQTAVEKFALDNVFHNVFLDAHRDLMSWAKEWYPMTMEQIRELEARVQEEQRNQTFENDGVEIPPSEK